MPAVSNLMMRRFWLTLLVLAAAACASTPKKPSAAELAAQARERARVSVLEGCYDCLIEARDTLTQLAVGKARPPLVASLFEVELLIALREREFAMNPAATLQRARALLPELPPDVDGARYLAVVEAIPPDALGTAQSEELAFRRDRGSYIPRVPEEINWLATGPLQPAVRQYLSLSLDCKYPRRSGPVRLNESVSREIPADAPPLIVYKIATCDMVMTTALDLLKARVPRFADTAIFRARPLVSQAKQNGAPGARELLDEAYGRFSKSPSVTYLIGNFQQALGDCRAALRYYDETLALAPVHENALLGRTVCLVYVDRQEDAIATATRMIELKTFNMHEAFFWRAWVYHARQNLPAAREDIERAKSIASSGNIHRLAGIIEHDQDDLTIAEKDLVAAKSASGGGADCVARWYLGLIAVKRKQSPEAAAHFEDAMGCYERNAELSEAAMRIMEAKTDLDPDFKARQIEGFKVAVAEDRSQQYAAAFNAANHLVQAGNRERAKGLLDIAAKDPSLEKVVSELRKFIGG